ncbi:hypothetical protein BH10PSE1_BH10PSE1_09890 [soil metagenome]
MRLIFAAVIASTFALASCERASEPAPTPAPVAAPAEPAQTEMTPGEKMQKRREDIAAAQIQAQFEAQMNTASAKKSD